MFERVLLFVHLFVGLRLLSMLVMWRPRVPRSFVRKVNWTRQLGRVSFIDDEPPAMYRGLSGVLGL